MQRWIHFADVRSATGNSCDGYCPRQVLKVIPPVISTSQLARVDCPYRYIFGTTVSGLNWYENSYRLAIDGLHDDAANVETITLSWVALMREESRVAH